MNESKPQPRLNIRFLFTFCTDVDAIRHFYTDLLGMTQSAYRNDEQWGWVCYQSVGFELMFFRDPDAKAHAGFAAQPGWEGGEALVTSWAVEVPEEEFAAVWRRLMEDGAKLFKPVPEWRQDSYWGISVLDPMGNTLEVYTMPKERPTKTVWES
jgi:catechol 2,3-dioxygenase-like lactoylglutathione lyase family enzyme